jgi:hypothetical protein
VACSTRPERFATIVAGLAFLIVEVADDDQLGGHVLAGNQAKEPRVQRFDAFEHLADLGVKCQASLTQTTFQE